MTTAPAASESSRAWRIAQRLASALILTSIQTSCIMVRSPSEDVSAARQADSGPPSGDPRAGLNLFVSKGCVICHSVNDVGGRAALPLDAPPDGREIDPMVFAAAMWEGAAAMLSLQLATIGYQIGMTGAELRDLAAFASDLESQADFSLGDVPADLRPWIIDAPHWLGEEWPEPFKSQPDTLPSPFQDL